MRHLLQLAFAFSGARSPARCWPGRLTRPSARTNAVAPATLDNYRGGFVTDTGLAVSLGLERIVTINGNVADTSQMSTSATWAAWPPAARR
jgi:hypothetical protein